MVGRLYATRACVGGPPAEAGGLAGVARVSIVRLPVVAVVDAPVALVRAGGVVVREPFDVAVEEEPVDAADLRSCPAVAVEFELPGVVAVAIGAVGAAGLTRLMSPLLFGINALDPMTYVMVPMLLVAATVVASYLPARRAAAVDPVVALKAE